MHLYFIRFEFWAKVVNLPVCAVDYLTEKGGEMENKGLKGEIVPAEMCICRKIPHLLLQHAIHIHCKPFGAECPLVPEFPIVWPLFFWQLPIKTLHLPLETDKRIIPITQYH